MHKFDPIVRDDAPLFARYMDDYLRNIKANKVQEKLVQINSLHPSLKFTMEREHNSSLPFLDKLIKSIPGCRVLWEFISRTVNQQSQ